MTDAVKPPCPKCDKPMVRAKAWPGLRSGWVCLKGYKGALGGCGHYILDPEKPKTKGKR